MKKLLLVAGVIVGLSWSVSAQQSLAELAKKNEEQRKAAAAAKAAAPEEAKPASKSYTNKDLGARSSRSDKVPETGDASTKATPPAAGVTGKKPVAPVVKDEKYWRAQILPYATRILDNARKTIAVQNQARTIAIEVSKAKAQNLPYAALETEQQRLSAEVKRLIEVVRVDTDAMKEIETQAVLGGANPAWFK